MAGRAMVTGTSAISRVFRFGGVNAVGREPELWAPPQLEGQGHRPHCCFCLVPCGHRCHCGQDAGVTYATSPAATRLSGAQSPWPEGQDYKHHLYFSLVLSLLCVPVHPPLGAQMCGTLLHPGVLNRGIFVEL